ncbi:MAG: diaminopimelate decarboxylase [Oligoflexia bacterium]|nr:diaminopimelate decarboxylase [Oligoflexia bacterium]
MRTWNYQNNELHIDNIPLSQIADQFDTPFYLYSLESLKGCFNEFKDSAKQYFHEKFTICYALKANPHPTILKTLASLGCGADIVSGGELSRALECGIRPENIVFSGVGKKKKEIDFAIKNNIASLNVESLEELELIAQIAKDNNSQAKVALRLNPDVKAKTHHHISTGNSTHKFGIVEKDILKAFQVQDNWKYITLVGLSVHIGSQLKNLEATRDAIIQLCQVANQCPFNLEFLDVGGGLGIDYHPTEDQDYSTPDHYMKLVSQTIDGHLDQSKKEQLARVVFEPGRCIVAKCGLLINSVIRRKESEGNHFLMVDGGMNDFVRSSLYDAYHELLPEKEYRDRKRFQYNVVGPICESADSFAKKRDLPEMFADELIAVADVGAYGRSMASSYNLREPAKEVVINLNRSITT